MSEEQKKSSQLTCPLCEKKADLDPYPVVDARAHPELKEEILSGEFFRWKCPNCGRRMKIHRQVFYFDREKRFMVCMVPGFHEECLLEERWEQQYPEFESFVKRVVADINPLKEKILILENGIDDQAIELCKLAISGVVRKKYEKPIRAIYFTRFDAEDGMIGFSFQFVGAKEMLLYQTRMDVYNLSIEVADEYRKEHSEEKGFLRVGPRWAKKVLDWYQQKGED